MSTENETWRDASSSEENSGAGRDGSNLTEREAIVARLITVKMVTALSSEI